MNKFSRQPRRIQKSKRNQPTTAQDPAISASPYLVRQAAAFCVFCFTGASPSGSCADILGLKHWPKLAGDIYPHWLNGLFSRLSVISNYIGHFWPQVWDINRRFIDISVGLPLNLGSAHTSRIGGYFRSTGYFCKSTRSGSSSNLKDPKILKMHWEACLAKFS